MGDLISVEPENTFEKVRFRQSILQAERQMKQWIESGVLTGANDKESIDQIAPLKHYFTPRDPKYG